MNHPRPPRGTSTFGPVRRSWWLAATLCILATRASAQEPAVEVTFLDVGQGDAVLVRSPEGRVAMIDAGSGSPLRFLQQMRVDSIDLLVASHPHADHIGGLDDVLTARPVRFYMDNGDPYTTATYERLMATVERLSSVTYLEATPRTVSLGTVTLEVLPMPPGERAVNDRSVGLLLRYGSFTALLSGDSERAELDWWTGQELVPRLTLLKAPHHGSVNGFTRAFLQAARPEVVVLSLGADNTYGHPRPEALAAYATYASEVRRTDRDGHVTVRGRRDGSWTLVTGEGGDGARPVVEERAGARTVASTALGERLSVRVQADAPGNDHENLNGEYVIIENRSGGDLGIGGWRVCDLSTRCFRFPPGARIAAGRQVRVYTGYGTDDGISFFMNNDRAVWNNDGDEATLYDQFNTLVVRHVY